ncbi:leucyl/phenylalanyl-tRNA--protein transferase [Aliidiomarina soli]|uniref:Leucyl/phenylalanyl-tRNA--protein transferase n=1 Tax=Aliidiomarina soli TaxID=1928574 RepID=A0A432WHP1_9GAMM|nr:leucyl/phenylalanyl-tRNA--protein transferase [Aliidiomarina soli]
MRNASSTSWTRRKSKVEAVLVGLDPDSYEFPDPQQALHEPNGLLAVGGDLSVPRLVEAYRQGIFPWFSDGDPLLWWSPDPRAVIDPQQLHIGRSLRKAIRKSHLHCTINHAFEEVISACSEQRAEREGTWITDDMYEAYCDLHQAGHAHSVEVWDKERLVGGLYGVLNGSIFCGESMFHKVTNASKIALVALCHHLQPAGLKLIDCQMPTPHLESLGATSLSRSEFLKHLKRFGEAQIDKDFLLAQPISGICA